MTMPSSTPYPLLVTGGKVLNPISNYGKAADDAAAGEYGAGLKLPKGGGWNYMPGK
jgi:hypothetical protein